MKLSEIKRKQIIEAAAEEFRSAGFNGTSMDKVAARANVSKRTVYNHFPSKDALFNGIVDYMLNMLSEATAIEYSSERNVREQLTELARREIELLSTPQFIDLARAVIAEGIHSPEKMQEASEQFAGIEDNLSQWFDAAAADGKLATSDGQFASNHFIGMLKTFCFWPQLIKNQPFPDSTEIEHIIETSVSMFVNYYEKKN
ncbi:TetR/AcrR family transcriptional regulator [Pleionea sp. CnH1-48]|uniref:TetR/AcrR family transcriptional regulator n=1 Tax=Pleionea sp. CnH1-48 TaxID=2954494 RepID=UPI00209837F6|nr:TetR/AcrR family transcriptional regulator [Pleionea sp. CnH1-48]MCO7225637.1 TetR/AcrR family transcriptional regulator [Pleionea sp. CnH1-48]